MATVTEGHRSIPEDWFVCPVTKEALVRKDLLLCSSFSCFPYVPDGDYWDFTPRDLAEMRDDKWQTWQALQENGVVSYREDPEHNLGVGRRRDFMAFADFCRFSGNVLDVGVGPQRVPTHIEYSVRSDVFFVGIDPLRGQQPKDFAFVQGLGEYLPFRSSCFDQVLFVTSLDHFIDPRRPLIEARRVLVSGGTICVWIGEKRKDAPRVPVTNDWYERLRVPAGAEDRFHFRRFASRELETWFRELDLLVKDKAVQDVDPWNKNIFYRVKR